MDRRGSFPGGSLNGIPQTEDGTIQVLWQSELTLAGFQFNVPTGCTLNSVEPLECDEGWSLYNSDDLVLCFAIAAGAYIDPSESEVGLVTIGFNAPYGTPLSFVDPIFADPGATSIDLYSADIHHVGLPDCPADVYPVDGGDGLVDVNDVLALISAWGEVDSPYDTNGDGVIDVADILEALNNWGSCD